MGVAGAEDPGRAENWVAGRDGPSRMRFREANNTACLEAFQEK
ncbi:hypothetical protein [Azospirillum doebereinerae]